MNIVFAFTTALLLASTTFAHEGHDTSGIQALYGGIVMPGEQINLELVQEGAMLKLYPLSHESKSMPLKPKDIKAFAKTEKRGKSQATSKELALNPDGEGFTTTPELKDVKHFKLEVKTTVNGKSDKFEFPIEPQG